MTETLQGILIGGAITLITTYLTHRWTAKKERTAELQKEKREKIQRLAHLVSELTGWTYDTSMDIMKEPVIRFQKDPMPEIKIIARLFFPDLESLAIASCSAVLTVIALRTASSMELHQTGEENKGRLERIQTAMDALLACNKAFLDAIQKEANKIYRS